MSKLLIRMFKTLSSLHAYTKSVDVSLKCGPCRDIQRFCISFVRRWGLAAVFIGRFFGPLRASVPLAAGIFHMPYWHFQLANFTSAFLWAGVLLGIGDVVTIVFEWGLGRMGGAL